MGNKIITKEQVIDDYFDSLLTKEDVDTDKSVINETVVEVIDIEGFLGLEEKSFQKPIKIKISSPSIEEESLQLFYFEVNNIKLAIPAEDLGGVYALEEINPIEDMPEWYLGLQETKDLETNGDVQTITNIEQVNVVDTTRWIMKHDLENKEYRQAYQYIVLLNNSSWGLASSKVIGIESAEKEKMRWQELEGKRPWLAGILEDKTCALLNVEATITTLNIEATAKIFK